MKSLPLVKSKEERDTSKDIVLFGEAAGNETDCRGAGIRLVGACEIHPLPFYNLIVLCSVFVVLITNPLGDTHSLRRPYIAIAFNEVNQFTFTSYLFHGLTIRSHQGDGKLVGEPTENVEEGILGTTTSASVHRSDRGLGTHSRRQSDASESNSTAGASNSTQLKRERR